MIPADIARGSASFAAPSRRLQERLIPTRPPEVVRYMAGSDFGSMISGSPAGDGAGLRSAEYERLDPYGDHLAIALIDSGAPLAATARKGRQRCRGSA